jgi:arylsulfatase A-like enzyme
MSAPSPPNVLWLVLEDVSPEFGCYDGPAAVETPHIDRLAEEGVRFTDAYATNPTCSPSRSALATGVYQMTIDAHHQRSHQSADAPSPPNPLPAGVRVVSDWLRDAGYYTANLVDFPESVGIEVSGKLDWNFDYRGDPFDTTDWGDLSGERPFFAQISFAEVHRGRYWDTAHERIDSPAGPADAVLPPYLPDHPVVREDFAQYYNTIMAADRKVGRVLEGLETEGWLADTVVVLTADHGRPMLRDKQQPYDSGLNVPLIVRWPENHPAPPDYERGAVDRRLVSSLDVTATTLAIAGVSVPEGMHGRVFFGEDADPPRDYVFSGVDRIAEVPGRRRTVRSRRYRYVRNYDPGRSWLRMNRHVQAVRDIPWVVRKLEEAGELDPVQSQYLSPTAPPEEFYDVVSDPHQTENLAGSLAHRERFDEFRAVLDDWVGRIDDRGRFPEHPEVLRYYEEQKQADYDERIRERREEWGL